MGVTDGAPGMVMPAYESSFNDAEMAGLAAYLRRTRTTAPPWKDLEKKVTAIRPYVLARIPLNPTRENGSDAIMTHI